MVQFVKQLYTYYTYYIWTLIISFETVYNHSVIDDKHGLWSKYCITLNLFTKLLWDHKKYGSYSVEIKAY